MISARAQLLWFAWFLLSALPAAAVTDYRLNVGAPASDVDLAGLQVVLHTVTQTEQDLLLRVGIFNPTDKAISTTAALAATDFALTAYAKGKRYQITPSTSTLTELCPGGVLQPKSMNNGLLTFSWGSKKALVETLGTMTLQVAHFSSVLFSLNQDKVFVPPDFDQTEKRSPINLELASKFEQLAIFTMRVNSLVLKDDALEVVLSFHNSSRYPVTWTGKINGTMACIITSHGDRLTPLEVSDSLHERIAPPGKNWAAGEDNVGWLRFPRPQPLASEQLLFAFPGFPVLRCAYDHEQHAWQPASRAVPADAPPPQVEAVLKEEHTYTELKDFWEEATLELSQRQYTNYLKHFRGGALQGQRASVASLSSLPVSSVAMTVPEYQRVKPDANGVLKDVHVEMHYTLATLPNDNIFVAQMECDMHRSDDGLWMVDEVRYPHMQPFWLLGYNAVEISEHFMVFHRNLADTSKQVGIALKQLETSYDHLLSSGLPLRGHYVAFLAAAKGDFTKLTERNQDNYTGMASASYLYRDSRVKVINQAMYINDYRIFALQRAWGMHDRQITMQHELVHLAMADMTRPWTPAWLVEGLAMHYASQCTAYTRDALRHVLTLGVSVRNLSELRNLGADTEDATLLMSEYQFSGETVQWLARTYGETAVLKLYEAYAAEVPANLAAMRGQMDTARDARLQFTRKIFGQRFGNLTLEQLDDQVRKTVMD